MSKLYTTTEAAAVLGIDTRTVSKLIRRNLLKADRFGQRIWMLSEQEVERYKHERRQPGRPRMGQSQQEYATKTEGIAMQSRQMDLSSLSDAEISEAAAGHWPARGEAFRWAALAEARGRGLLPMPTEREAWEDE